VHEGRWIHDERAASQGSFRKSRLKARVTFAGKQESRSDAVRDEAWKRW
jgi:hypothetical protein